jgi:hypothetical protein
MASRCRRTPEKKIASPLTGVIDGEPSDWRDACALSDLSVSQIEEFAECIGCERRKITSIRDLVQVLTVSKHEFNLSKTCAPVANTRVCLVPTLHTCWCMYAYRYLDAALWLPAHLLCNSHMTVRVLRSICAPSLIPSLSLSLFRCGPFLLSLPNPRKGFLPATCAVAVGTSSRHQDMSRCLSRPSSRHQDMSRCLSRPSSRHQDMSRCLSRLTRHNMNAWCTARISQQKDAGDQVQRKFEPQPHVAAGVFSSV